MMKRRKSKDNVRRWQTIGICILVIVCIFCVFVSSEKIINQKEVGAQEQKFEEHEEQVEHVDHEEQVEHVDHEEHVEHVEQIQQNSEINLPVPQEVEEDDVPPEIFIHGDSTVWLYTLEEFIEPGFEANDNEDGDLTENVTSTIITLEEGKEYQIEYSVSDSSNNISKVTRDIKITNGKVYLTFDDGPSSISEKVLDILKEQDIKATFFVIGENIVGREDIIEREFNEGHTIGLHGYSHRNEIIYQNISTLMDNFETVANQVEAIIGKDVKDIRFPGGTSNTVSANYCEGIMSQAIEEVSDEGYVYWDWNVDSADAYPKTTADEVYHNVVDSIQSGRTNVVLFHDLGGNDKMLEVLPKIIDYCKQNNYELLPINEETTLVQHHAFN